MTAEVLRYAAFSVAGRGGNPAGVVLDADTLSDGQMLAIAQAIGYSETAFVSSTAADRTPGELPAGVDVRTGRIRFFSPLAEVAFCGHATVATAVALAERHHPGRLRLSTVAGPITVETRVEEGDLVATLTSPPTQTRPVDDQVLDEAVSTFRLTRDDLDRRYPSHVAYAGNEHLVLGVRSRATLALLDYDFPRLAQLMAREQWTTTHVFWSESATTFHVRNAFPPGGVVEDPATGAAAAAFGGYLRALGLVPVPGRVVLHQGHDLGRPSLLLVDLTGDSDTVQVTGRATRLPLSPYDEHEASS